MSSDPSASPVVIEDDDVSDNVIMVEDASPARTDLLLRHDIVNILINAQRTETRARARVLERKTILVRYCSVMLRWLERTFERKNGVPVSGSEVKVASSSSSPNYNSLVIESASPSPHAGAGAADGGADGGGAATTPKAAAAASSSGAEVHGLVRVGSPTRTARGGGNGIGNSGEQQFVAIPHATLHNLRRQWQRRTAAILEKRSFAIVRQRFFILYKTYIYMRRCSRGALHAVSSVETAASLNRKRKRQIVLNSVEMQKVRALKALCVRAFFKWRLFAMKRGGGGGNDDNNKKTKREVIVAAAAAAAASAGTAAATQQPTGKAEGDAAATADGQPSSSSSVAPASLSQLVESLQSSSAPAPKSPPPTPPKQASARPTFFHAPPDDLGFSPLNDKNNTAVSKRLGADFPILAAEKNKVIKGQLKALRKEMAKMRGDVRQAAQWIAAECTQWDLHFQRKVRGGPSPLPTTSSSSGSGNGTGDKKQQQHPAPPSWEYERALLTRRASAYDALVEDHRMLSESLHAAEEDIARLRSIAVLRELHSPETSLAGGVTTAGSPNRIGLSTNRLAIMPASVHRSAAAAGSTTTAKDATSPGSAQVPPEELGVQCFAL